MFKSISTLLLSTVLASSLLLGVSANASTATSKSVTVNVSSLNVRNSTCKSVGVMKKGQEVMVNTKKIIKCKINGKTAFLTQVNAENKYISLPFTKASSVKPAAEKTPGSYKIAVNTLNLRDSNCKIIGTVAKNVVVYSNTGAGPVEPKLQTMNCKINGSNVKMVSIYHDRNGISAQELPITYVAMKHLTVNSYLK